MKPLFYHSALKANASLQAVGGESITLAEHRRAAFYRHDIVEANGFHPRIAEVEVIVACPPYPSGQAIFDGRAGIKDRTYQHFASAFAKAWAAFAKPKACIINATLLKYLAAEGVPEPTAKVPVYLPHGKERMFCWGFTHTSDPVQLAYFTATLGSKYRSMGDPMCGYGNHLHSFLKAHDGNTVIGTDYNGQCLAVASRMMRDA